MGGTGWPGSGVAGSPYLLVGGPNAPMLTRLVTNGEGRYTFHLLAQGRGDAANGSRWIG